MLKFIGKCNNNITKNICTTGTSIVHYINFRILQNLKSFLIQKNQLKKCLFLNLNIYIFIYIYTDHHDHLLNTVTLLFAYTIFYYIYSLKEIKNNFINIYYIIFLFFFFFLNLNNNNYDPNLKLINIDDLKKFKVELFQALNNQYTVFSNDDNYV